MYLNFLLSLKINVTCKLFYDSVQNDVENRLVYSLKSMDGTVASELKEIDFFFSENVNILKLGNGEHLTSTS